MSQLVNSEALPPATRELEINNNADEVRIETTALLFTVRNLCKIFFI